LVVVDLVEVDLVEVAGTTDVLDAVAMQGTVKDAVVVVRVANHHATRVLNPAPYHVPALLEHVVLS